MLIGIVGKANVGKSTFFKALTLSDVLIANYPFATIDPNKGFGFVRVKDPGPDMGVVSTPRTGFLKDDLRFVPVEVIDVAGLVPGAHEGKGMGNQFLNDLIQADALIHVVDMSGSSTEKGEPCEPGTHDPISDIKFLEVELDMWTLGLLKKGWDKFARQIQQQKQNIAKSLAKQLGVLKATDNLIQEIITKLKLDENPMKWSDEQLLKLAQQIRRMTKPILIAANKIDIHTADANLARCKTAFPHYTIIPVSAEAELTLKQADKAGLINYTPGNSTFTIKGTLSDKQKQALEYIQKKILDKYKSTGVQHVMNTAVFDILRYIAIFPGSAGGKLGDSHGRILPDCFLLPPGSTPLDFAAKIHTDLVKNFVTAVDCRTKRKIGKDTQLKNLDIIEILTSK